MALLDTESNTALANISIAITRPINQATKLTQLIQAAGGNVIPFSLIEITPLNDYKQFESVINIIHQYDWVIFISSNAVHNSMPMFIKKGVPSTLKFAAIGPVTAKELGQFGIEKVLIPKGNFDSESLLSLPEMQGVKGKKILIVRGVGGREVLANTLKSRGATVNFGECYQRINPQTNCDILANAYANQQLQSIIVTSSEAMRHLLDLAYEATWLQNITICVSHVRIAELPLKMGLKVIIAKAPGDTAMIDLLLKTHIKF
ncbi:MAG: uroporphyrinogen-III synthase [Methylophilaceae bacterium]